MKKLIAILMIIMVVIGLIILGCSKRNTTPVAEEDTPTVTATNTPGGPTAIPTNTQSIPAGMIDNCEDGNNENLWGGYWYTYNDAGDGGSSTIWPAAGGYVSMTAGGYNSSYALRVYGSTGSTPTYAFAGVGTQLNPNAGCPGCQKSNISSYTGIKFWIKGTKSGSMVMNVILPYTGSCDVNKNVCQNLAAYDDFKYSVPNANFDNTWHQVTIPFSNFTTDGWGSPPANIGIVKAAASEIQFQFKGPNSTFDVYIDDIELY